LLVLAFVSPGALAATVAMAVAFSPVLLALYAWRRGGKAAAERDRALDQAWALAASDLIRERGREIDAPQLGKLMRMGEDQAEQLLARLSVEDFVRARVTDSGDLLYEPSHARVEADLPALDTDQPVDQPEQRARR
jgi:hypothetical protein